VRRSLIEFTLPEPKPAVVEAAQPVRLPVKPRPAKAHAENSSAGGAKKTQMPVRGRRVRSAVRRDTPDAEARAAAKSKRREVLHPFDGVTAVTAKAARDYRTWIFSHAKSNLGAALDYAGRVAVASLSPASPSSASRRRGGGASRSSREENVSASAPAGAEICAKAFEIMSANVDAAIECARQLSEVQSLSEFVQLSAGHVRRQVEQATVQTATLRALTRSLTGRHQKKS
jgi:hypothetical protein